VRQPSAVLVDVSSFCSGQVDQLVLHGGQISSERVDFTVDTHSQGWGR
jgi:hypothetical protein